jgi:hypothetical protein
MKIHCPLEQDVVEVEKSCHSCRFWDGQRCSFTFSVGLGKKWKKMRQLYSKFLKRLSAGRTFPHGRGQTWKRPPVPEKWSQPCEEETEPKKPEQDETYYGDAEEGTGTTEALNDSSVEETEFVEGTKMRFTNIHDEDEVETEIETPPEEASAKPLDQPSPELLPHNPMEEPFPTALPSNPMAEPFPLEEETDLPGEEGQLGGALGR